MQYGSDKVGVLENPKEWPLERVLRDKPQERDRVERKMQINNLQIRLHFDKLDVTQILYILISIYRGIQYKYIIIEIYNISYRAARERKNKIPIKIKK